MKRLSLALLCAGPLVACGGVDDGGIGEGDFATSASAICIDESDSSWQEAWNSGNTNNLSNWRALNCNADDTEHVLYSLRGRRERSSNLDNFVAGLDARCREYLPGEGLFQPWTAAVFVELFDSVNTRLETTIQVPTETNRVAVGVELNLNTGEDYVRNIKLRHTVLSSSGLHTAITTTSGVTTISGNKNAIETCPSDEVMTGIRIQHNTNNGKIRRVQIRCTRLCS